VEARLLRASFNAFTEVMVATIRCEEFGLPKITS
jgi:hypothetical protein